MLLGDLPHQNQHLRPAELLFDSVHQLEPLTAQLVQSPFRVLAFCPGVLAGT